MNETVKIKPKAIVVGGSIGGVSSAHALISAGWEVVVIEKSVTPPKGSPTGAGISIDSVSQHIINSWTGNPQLFQDISMLMKFDHHQTSENGVRRVLVRDELNFRCLHWADLHDLLYSSLPPDIFLWGHMYLSFSTSEDKTSVKVKAKVIQTGEIIELNGDLLVAADGIRSSIRQACLPDLKMRYTGYYAWRGVFDFSGKENSETVLNIKRAYPDLGKCLYTSLTTGSHIIFFELPRKRLNWLWYIHQPEPQLKGNSVTMKVSSEMIEEMHQEAEKVWDWDPEMVRIMKDTKEPFINFIYDCDPPEKMFFDNVVLVGDAAHPSTPHYTRATNMTIVDAAVLGKCLEKYGAENLASALEKYQKVRQPVTSKQVLYSRRAGRIKQGLPIPDREPFDPKTASPEYCQELLLKSMPFFPDLSTWLFNPEIYLI